MESKKSIKSGVGPFGAVGGGAAACAVLVSTDAFVLDPELIACFLNASREFLFPLAFDLLPFLALW